MVSKLFFYNHLANSSLVVDETSNCQIVKRRLLNAFKIDKMLKIIIIEAFMNNLVKIISVKKKGLKRA